MVILPEGASGLKIFFRSSFIGSPVKKKQSFYSLSCGHNVYNFNSFVHFHCIKMDSGKN